MHVWKLDTAKGPVILVWVKSLAQYDALHDTAKVERCRNGERSGTIDLTVYTWGLAPGSEPIRNRSLIRKESDQSVWSR